MGQPSDTPPSAASTAAAASPTPPESLELLRGTLDLLVLKSLTWGPQHGYAVAEGIQRRTEGEILVEEGALYPALHRLERRGWIASEWGLSENNRKAKYYHLTADGRRQLVAALDGWRRYAAAVSKVVEATSPA